MTTEIRANSSTVPVHTAPSLLVIIGVSIIGLALVMGDIPSWTWLFGQWTTNPDNSHGLLVPVFAAVLLWLRRDLAAGQSQERFAIAFALGILLIVAATAMKCAGVYCRMKTVEAISIVPLLSGIVLCCGGWRTIRAAWPSLFFLIFMVPLPRVIGMQLAGTLQRVATVCSTFVMQLIGLPAVSEGNLIFLTETTLGVAEACSGIRMMMSFFAVTMALCFVVNRSAWEKALLIASAPCIAVVANVLRITATGVAFEYGNARLADLIFHDLAGWLMMPTGLVLLWVQLIVLDRIYPMLPEQDMASMHRHLLNSTRRRSTV